MANEIAALRNFLGINQDLFARLLGITRSSLAMAESSFRTLPELAKIRLNQIDLVCLPLLETEIPIPPIQMDAGFCQRQINMLNIRIERETQNLEGHQLRIQNALKQNEFCKRYRSEIQPEQQEPMEILLLRIEKRATSALSEQYRKEYHHMELELEALLSLRLFWMKKLNGG